MNDAIKRVLVTGGAGFIGSNLIRFLRRERPDWELVNLDALTYAGNLASLGEVMDDPKHTFIQGSIADRETVRRAMDGCDVVMNLAAESHVDRSILDSGPFIETNVHGTQVLLDVAREIGVSRFLQVSTDEVYGELPLEHPEMKFTEDSPLHPKSPYSASKAAGDLLALAYAETFGLPVTVTRGSNTFGPYQFPEKVIPLFMINLLRGERVPLYGDGLNVRDWIHVDDHARALLAVLEQGRPATVYNIGADNEQSNLDLTHHLLELTGRDESFIQYVEDRLGHDRRYALEAARLQVETGWRPVSSRWPQALAETVAWYRENEPWWDAILKGEYRSYYRNQYGDRLPVQPTAPPSRD